MCRLQVSSEPTAARCSPWPRHAEVATLQQGRSLSQRSIVEPRLRTQYAPKGSAPRPDMAEMREGGRAEGRGKEEERGGGSGVQCQADCSRREEQQICSSSVMIQSASTAPCACTSVRSHGQAAGVLHSTSQCSHGHAQVRAQEHALGHKLQCCAAFLHALSLSSLHTSAHCEKAERRASCIPQRQLIARLQ